MMKAGATVQRVNGPSVSGLVMPKQSWTHISAKKFVVRQPDYAARKQKAASAESLYELMGVDWYRAEKRLARVGDRVDLPRAQFSHPSVPSLLIVNVQLPSEGPKMFGTPPADGPTLHAVFYFTLREETARALRGSAPLEPSLRLLVDYFSRAESESAVRKRFKALGIVNNLDVVNFNPLMGPFNGKPVLITESGSLERGIREAGRSNGTGCDGRGHLGAGGDVGLPAGGAKGSPTTDPGVAGARFSPEEFLELDINVRRWSFLARKGLEKLEPKFGQLNVSVAFLIEGREDGELPERLLGCGTLNALGSGAARALDV